MANNKISLFFKSLLLGIFIFGFGVNGHAATLPAGYTELEYIESTGTQYIDTGISITSGNFQIDADMQFTSTASPQYFGIYGGGYFGITDDYFAAGGRTISKSADTQRHKFIFSSIIGTNVLLNLSIDGTNYNISRDVSAGRIYLLVVNNSGTFMGATKAKLYSVQIYSNGTLVRNLIPAKNSSNVVGMYDTVSQTFFTNAGTGTFAAGPAVVTNSGAISSVTVAGLVAQNGTPTPTTPIDIVSNNGVLKVSPNLINYGDSSWQDGYFSSSGTVSSSQSGFNEKYSQTYIPVNPGEAYTFSNVFSSTPSDSCWVGVAWYTSDKTFISRATKAPQFTANPVARTLIAPTNAVYARVSFRTFEGATNVQFEQGSTATPYKPYGQIYTDGTVETIGDSANHTATVATLLGIGDYRDTQNINTGAITRNVGVKVLNGTENWTYNAEQSRFITNVSNLVVATARTLPFVCTHYQVTYRSTTAPGYIYNSSNKQQIMITDAHTSVEDWTQWLADQYANGTPVIIVYPLATPTTESVAGQTMTTAPVNNRTGGVAGMTITTLLSSGVIAQVVWPV